jgi:hypothetical protein
MAVPAKRPSAAAGNAELMGCAPVDRMTVEIAPAGMTVPGRDVLAGF